MDTSTVCCTYATDSYHSTTTAENLTQSDIPLPVSTSLEQGAFTDKISPCSAATKIWAFAQ